MIRRGILIKNKIIDFIQKYFLYSFKSTINTLYLPIVIICIFITGLVSSRLATAQIEENAYKNITDTIFQTKNYLDYTLSDVFSQLVSLSYDSRVMGLLAKEREEIVPEDYIPLHKNLQIIYSRYNTILESVLIDLNEGDFLLYNSEYNSNPHIDYEEYFTNYDESSENFYWLNIHRNRVFNQEGNVLSTYKLLTLNNASAKGIILFNLREDFFEGILNRSLIGENGYLTLISPDGNYESKELGSQYQLNKDTLHKLQNTASENGRFTYENEINKKMIVVYDTIKTNNWKIAAVVPEEELLSKINYIKHFTIALMVIMIVLVVILTNIVIKLISKPFDRLAKQMGTVNENHLVLEEEMSGPKEMKVLHNGFTDLMDRIHLLMDQIRLEQEEKRRLEFAIMQSQINPHFLYNTLYSIKGLCDMGLTKDASQMITALSNFFRIGISKGSEVISIEEEIEHIQNYLYIQEMRYGDDFSYEIDVMPDILSYPIVKLSLQPLIENAIYHGVKQKRGQGKILIKGYADGDVIHLQVADNGNGISKEKLQVILNELASMYEEKNHIIGIGLKSVNERIKIQFGREYGLTIASEEGVGTTSSISIPKQQGG